MASGDKNIVLGCCRGGMEDESVICCTKCKKSYHYTCLPNFDDTIRDATNWTCAECSKKNLATPLTSNTPVRSNSNVTKRKNNKRQALNSPPATDHTLTSDDIRTIVQDIIKKELTEQLSIFKSSFGAVLNVELQTVKDEIKEMKNSMQFMNQQYEDFRKQHLEWEGTIEDIKMKNEAMQETMRLMESRINQLEQNARANNVEIQCLPEKSDENLLSIVSKIGDAIKCKLNDEQIVKCTRIAKMHPESNRPRSVVVQFSSTRIRDKFLAANIEFNKSQPLDKLNTSHLGLEGKKWPIYVVEHLSPANKALCAATRSKAKDKGYAHVWVRGGRILVRKTDSSKYIVIKNHNSLNLII